MRSLAANDRYLRLLDLLETQHVAAHPSPSSPLGLLSFRPSVAQTPVVRLVTCIVSTPWVLATRPPPWCSLVMAGRMGWDRAVRGRPRCVRCLEGTIVALAEQL